ncbi:MAG TPA: hypothetical protein VI384_04350 [Candidatus Dormibacteraeota bacterium]
MSRSGLHTGIFDLSCSRCSWTCKDAVGQRSEYAQKAHLAAFPKHEIRTVEQLPAKPVVGDRVRLTPELEKLARAAYPDAAIGVFDVVGEFDNRVYGEPMLKLSGAPHMARPNQVELAWRNDGERRKALGL